MSFRDNPGKQIPLIIFFGCLMPLMALNRTGRLDSIHMVDFLLIFFAGFGLGVGHHKTCANEKNRKLVLDGK